MLTLEADGLIFKPCGLIRVFRVCTQLHLVFSTILSSSIGQIYRMLTLVKFRLFS